MRRRGNDPLRPAPAYTIHDLPIYTKTYNPLRDYERDTGINPLTLQDRDLLRIRMFGSGSLADLRAVQAVYEATHPAPAVRVMTQRCLSNHPLLQEP